MDRWLSRYLVDTLPIFQPNALAKQPCRHTMLCMEVSNPGRTIALMDESLGPTRIRIALVDGHLLFRESLARLLSMEGDFELVAECKSAPKAARTVKGARADVVLVDLGIAVEFIQCARKSRCPGTFLVIAREIDPADSAALLKCGASGIFLDSDSSTRLSQAIRLVASGEAWIGQKVIHYLIERYPNLDPKRWSNLTPRERTVLQGVVDGLSNRKIGVQIGASESTVKAALQQLFRKAGVRTRSQLVRVALEGSGIAQ